MSFGHSYTWHSVKIVVVLEVRTGQVLGYVADIKEVGWIQKGIASSDSSVYVSYE